jgi:Fur family ferric uptake transcriptional regulator
MIAKKDIVIALRQRGHKLTPQRQAILNILTQTQDHLTPAAIYERVHQEHPNIGLVTVYRTLELLAGMGLICEVHVGGSCRSYLIKRPSGHHHHLICSGCGTVVDFTDCDLSELEEKLCRETGFEIESHLLEFLGRCQDCQKKASK